MSADTQELKHQLTDINAILAVLGLDQNVKRQANGKMISCPWHAENDASCSVSIGRDGTIRVKCFGCSHGSDVFGLIAVSQDLDVKRDFKAVLDIALSMAGQSPLPSGTSIFRAPPRVVQPLPYSYKDMQRIWESGQPVTEDKEVAAWVKMRGLNLDNLAAADVARVLTRSCKWLRTGYKLIMPLRDHTGEIKNLVARYVGNDSDNPNNPKSKTPFGLAKSGLCLMNSSARDHFRGRCSAGPLYVVEGDPDFLTLASLFPDVPIMGITGEGTIIKEYQEKLRELKHVAICTHADKSGDKYTKLLTLLLTKEHKTSRVDLNKLIKGR